MKSLPNIPHLTMCLIVWLIVWLTNSTFGEAHWQRIRPNCLANTLHMGSGVRSGSGLIVWLILCLIVWQTVWTRPSMHSARAYVSGSGAERRPPHCDAWPWSCGRRRLPLPWHSKRSVASAVRPSVRTGWHASTQRRSSSSRRRPPRATRKRHSYSRPLARLRRKFVRLRPSLCMPRATGRRPLMRRGSSRCCEGPICCERPICCAGPMPRGSDAAWVGCCRGAHTDRVR